MIHISKLRIVLLMYFLSVDCTFTNLPMRSTPRPPKCHHTPLHPSPESPNLPQLKLRKRSNSRTKPNNSSACADPKYGKIWIKYCTEKWKACRQIASDESWINCVCRARWLLFLGGWQLWAQRNRTWELEDSYTLAASQSRQIYCEAQSRSECRISQR